MFTSMRNVTRQIFVLAGLVICLSFGPSAKAGFEIKIVDSSIQVNSVGFVDVLISGGSSDASLATVLYAFRITAVGPDPASGTITFQGFERPSGSSYVFASSPLVDPILSNDEGNNIYSGSDSSEDFSNVTLPSNETKQLVRIRLKHQMQANTAISQAIGNQYKIQLFEDSGLTAIFDQDVNPLLINESSFENFSTLTVTAVPEPGSLLLVGSALCGGLLMRRRQTARLRTKSALDREDSQD